MQIEISRKEDAKVLAKQEYKCANKPESGLYCIEDYECLLWKGHEGLFDKSGHKIVWKKNDEDPEDNIQALCPGCYRVFKNNYQEKVSKRKKKIRKIASETIHNEEYVFETSLPVVILNCIFFFLILRILIINFIR